MRNVPVDTLFLFLSFQAEKAVAVAAGIKVFYPVYPEPCLRGFLRVKLHKIHASVRYGSKEGDIMLLCHGVIHRYKILILGNFNIYYMLLIRLLGAHGRQGDAAAAYNRRTR